MTTHINNIIHVAIATPLRQHFDYLPPDNVNITHLKAGTRVLVPFGRQNKVGIVISVDEHSEFPKEKLKAITKILDDEPLLDASIIALCEWASRYYQHPLGEVLHSALPTMARKAGSLTQCTHDHFYANTLEELPKLTIRQRALYDILLLTPGLTGSQLKQHGFSQTILRTALEKKIIFPSTNPSSDNSTNIISNDEQT